MKPSIFTDASVKPGAAGVVNLYTTALSNEKDDGAGKFGIDETPQILDRLRIVIEPPVGTVPKFSAAHPVISPSSGNQKRKEKSPSSKAFAIPKQVGS